MTIDNGPYKGRWHNEAQDIIANVDLIQSEQDFQPIPQTSYSESKADAVWKI